MWTRLCQPLTARSPKTSSVSAATSAFRCRTGAVEEADDAGDHEHAADQRAVEPRRSSMLAIRWFLLAGIAEAIVADYRRAADATDPCSGGRP